MSKTNAERQKEYRERGRELVAKQVAELMAQVDIQRSESGEVITISMGLTAIKDLELVAQAQDTTVTALMRTAIEGPMTMAVRARKVVVHRFFVV